MQLKFLGTDAPTTWGINYQTIRPKATINKNTKTLVFNEEGSENLSLFSEYRVTIYHGATKLEESHWLDTDSNKLDLTYSFITDFEDTETYIVVLQCKHMDTYEREFIVTYEYEVTYNNNNNNNNIQNFISAKENNNLGLIEVNFSPSALPYILYGADKKELKLKETVNGIWSNDFIVSSNLKYQKVKLIINGEIELFALEDNEQSYIGLKEFYECNLSSDEMLNLYDIILNNVDEVDLTKYNYYLTIFSVTFENNIIDEDDTILYRKKYGDNIWEQFYKDAYSTLFNDATVESGVFYQYKEGTFETNPVMVLFEDIYLSNKNSILKIRYNPSINNIKYIMNESITTTLGSQYPFIRRNGNTKYRQFTIGGLISCLADEQGQFLTKEEAYGDQYELLTTYEEQNQVSDYTNEIYERKFRDKVIEFLHSGNVMLFRSTHEGNMLVYLTNIQLTPDPKLGRRIYSFSAQATEVAECTVENLKKYGFLEGE